MVRVIAFLLLLMYAGGIYYIAKRTESSLTGSGRWIVILCWPVFLLFSPRFRDKL